MELRFEYGKSNLQTFDTFVSTSKKGDAKILPTIGRVIKILEEVDVKDQTEVVLITNNDLVDYNEEKVMQLVEILKEQLITITAISMNEHHSEKYPINFWDKIYYINE